MSHVKVTNGVAEIYTIGQLRRDHPNTSFPKNPSPELLVDYDMYPLSVEAEPEVDRLIQMTELGDPKLVDGSWVREWTVSNLPSELAAANIRNKRDKILSQDVDTMNPLRWEALSDINKDGFRTYRQALLDVPSQPGFPYSVTWPVNPLGE